MTSEITVSSHHPGNPRMMQVYLVYRLVLALLLWGLYAAGLETLHLGANEPELYITTLTTYTTLAALSLAVCYRLHYQPGTALLFFILLTDIVVISLMMDASGGLGSGIGYLLLITVAAGSYFFRGQLAILTAAIASICLILESSLSVLLNLNPGNNIFAAGVLGILLFTTALLIQGLNKALVIAEERARSEAEQSAQLQQLNELIVSNMLTGIIVLDQQGRIELINEAARELLSGNSRVPSLARNGNLSTEPELLARLNTWRANTWSRPDPFSPSNSNFEVLATFKNLDKHHKGRTIIFLEDFRSASHQAQQLKLASLGRLTGSIAHEIRNPLGAISHASELLSEQLASDAGVTRLTAIIEKQVRRVNQIVENVLQLSRKQQHNFARIELNDWLKNFVRDYFSGAPYHPEIQFELTDKPLSVTFDPVHLEQIITNLLDNAVRYSHEVTGHHWAGIRTGIGEVDRIPYLDIIDHGPGVPHKHQAKLFEPFFTTSKEGSGLGLYIARELCQINYATLRYQEPQNYKPGYFRIGFAHPGKILSSEPTA